MMADTSHIPSLLGGIAAILAALAWPLVTSCLLWAFRAELRAVVPILLKKVNDAETLELPGFKIAGIIKEAVSSAPPATDKETIPRAQVEGAKRLEAELSSAGVGIAQTATIVQQEISSLAAQYEELRNSMSPSYDRTQEMDQVMAGMRTLGIRAGVLLPKLILSAHPGERLAAIAALQVQPDVVYAHWLAERMCVETPFVFFHAALALRALAQQGKKVSRDALRNEVEAARKVILSYSGGAPDTGTVSVLEEATALLKHA